MRLTTLLLVVALVHAGFSAYSQITLQEKNAPLEKVLAAIEKQTKYVFLYDPEEMARVTITVYVKNAGLRETLEKCFKGLPIEFTVRGNNVLLKKNKISDHAATGRTILLQRRHRDKSALSGDHWEKSGTSTDAAAGRKSGADQ